MELVDIIAIRDRSAGFKSGKQSPWSTDFPAMARKTVVRSLANHLPWQVQKAAELEGRHDRGEATWATKANGDDAITIDGQATEDTAAA